MWKKSCVKNRDKVFEKVSNLLDTINADLSFQGLCFEKREEYAVEYLQEILNSYGKTYDLNPALFVTGSGHRKSREQRLYQELQGYMDRLKNYAERIEICGESRNSYSKR